MAFLDLLVGLSMLVILGLLAVLDLLVILGSLDLLAGLGMLVILGSLDFLVILAQLALLVYRQPQPSFHLCTPSLLKALAIFSPFHSFAFSPLKAIFSPFQLTS